MVWGTIVVALVVFAALPPLLSHDVYSYVDYARLGVLHGLDPYTHPPGAAPADPAYADVTWIDATSAYGPLFTLATYPLAWLPVGVAVCVLKAVAAAAVLAIAVLVARLAASRGLDPLRAAVFVGLNPLVLVHVAGGGHNDALAMLLATLGVAAVVAAREASGAIALVASVAVKASTAFVAPFALLGARRRGRFLVGGLCALVTIGLAGQFAFGWSWIGALGLAGENQGRSSHMSIPVTAARLTGLNAEAVRVAAFGLYAALVAYLLVWAWRGNDWVRAAGWAGLGLLLATSWLLPWYLILALPLVAISRDSKLMTLTLLLTAYQLGARLPI